MTNPKPVFDAAAEKRIAMAKWKSRVANYSVDTREDGERGLIAKKILLAVRQKDTAYLADVLSQHPDMCHAVFVFRRIASEHGERGFLAHMLLDLGWIKPLNFLADAGDRFSRPGPGMKGLSAMEHAVARTDLPAVARMLQCGGDPQGEIGHPPLGAMPHSRQTLHKETEIAYLLVKAGLDPWSEATHMEGRPLLLGLLREARPEAAMGLLKLASAPGERVDNAQAWTAWDEGVRRFIMSSRWRNTVEQGLSYVDCASRMHELGMGLPNLASVVDLALLMGKEANGLVKNIQAGAMISHLLERHKFDQENLRLAVELAPLERDDISTPWITALENAWLEASTMTAHTGHVSFRL
jgi:hypothetical protein